MSSIDVFLFSSSPSGPQKTLILGVSGISNSVLCAKGVILRWAEILKREATPAMRLLNDLLNMHDGYDGEGWLKECKKRMVDTFPREDPFSILVPEGFDIDKHQGPLQLPLEADDVLLRVDFVREVDALLQEVRAEQNELQNAQGLDAESIASRLKQQEKQRAICLVFFSLGRVLGAFAEFVSEFDMPSGSSSKNKDASVLETGRPFSPAMFEGVLKNFTPDVPTSISGRPRQEDAQEFLSFIMDQMHDELLKLEGQP
ncbi:protein PALE CRESS chloroplastic [Prunus yedoensis var. nudiflora]|uniref:Protein PALE CRESS chloroplastic n=1 Tax=Prunus yedoensis var. nudiflora TaxID=2094558 RepID=A0A314Z3Z1_PRUYE|nr:protein PALE CRESS chloroplastic [Prunus yedoensis var. nudiflora]